jgi:hypothetical protein
MPGNQPTKTTDLLHEAAILGVLTAAIITLWIAAGFALVCLAQFLFEGLG